MCSVQQAGIPGNPDSGKCAARDKGVSNNSKIGVHLNGGPSSLFQSLYIPTIFLTKSVLASV